jgi:hypothetical protein
VTYICLLAFLIACKKDTGNDRRVSESIFGIYTKLETSGDWRQNIFAPATKIKVSSLELNPIEIIINYKSLYPAFTLVFDSVMLNNDNTFGVNQIIQDQLTASGYSKGAGNGSFGIKKISLDFSVTRDGLIGNDRIIFKNIEKSSD